MLSTLSHPNIISILDVEVNTEFVIILEDGGIDLSRVLLMDKSKGAIAQRHGLACDLFNGLSYIHSLRIAHTDVKPANLAVDTKGVHRLRLLDFGSCIIDLPGFRRSHSMADVEDEGGLRYGTIWYRSIEVLLGDSAFGAAHDIWSAGCVVAELARREPLFRKTKAEHMIEYIFKVCGRPEGVSMQYLAVLPLWRPRLVHTAMGCCIHDAFHGVVPKAEVDWVSRLIHLHPASRPSAAEARGYFAQSCKI